MSVDNITDVYPYINVNGRLQEKESLSFPFLDYGFLYGYGAFDTILINQGHPVLLENHFKRLQRTSILLDIPCPYNFQTLETNIQELAAQIRNEVMGIGEYMPDYTKKLKKLYNKEF